MPEPSVSLVVTTYNRRAVVTDLIGKLGDQTDKDFEVVVAIDGSTDGTADALMKLAPPFPLRWVDTGCKGYGLALARNAGILAARGDIVAVIDDDSVPGPGFIAAHRAACRSRTITGGPRDPHDPRADPRLAEKMTALRALPPETPMALADIYRDYPAAYLVENNVSMRREDWIALGLFTERLRLYGVIGQEFFARAAHFGFRYQFVPAAGVVHREELEGDNGLHRARKRRQTRIAEMLRPALMRPTQFEAQARWAAERDGGQELAPFPAWWPAALMRLPRAIARQVRLMMREARR